jgi:hypothetical protein
MTCVGNLSFVARITRTSQIVRIRSWSCLRILLGLAFACTTAGHRLQLSAIALGAARICQRNPPSLILIVRSMTIGNDAVGEFLGELKGRSGHILYRESPKELKMYWEMGVQKEMDGSQSYPVLITCDFSFWLNPKGEALSEQHQLAILTALRQWLRLQGARSSIDLPDNVSEESINCVWRDCRNHRLSGYYYCREHFDLSCLANIR